MRSTCILAHSFLLCLVCVATSTGQARPATQPERLPNGFLRHAYYHQVTAPPNGTPPWRWRLSHGTLPSGITLEPNGLLAGAPTTPGEYRFTLESTDSSPKPLLRSQDFVLTVPPPLTLAWAQPPRVTAEGAISGILEVTNGSGRELDLTLIVVAVNTFNKAFALGYQRFTFAVGSQRVPFSSALPRDSYVVHADAIGEAAATLEIFRARLQTSSLVVP